MKFFTPVFLAVTLLFAAPLGAQDASAKEAPAVTALDTDLDNVPTGKEVAVDFKDVVDAVLDTKVSEDAAKEGVTRAMAIAMAIAALLKLLLSFVKLFASATAVFKNKNTPRLIALGVGAAAFLASTIGAGVPWWEALIIAGGGPGAVLLHEMLKLVPERVDSE